MEFWNNAPYCIIYNAIELELQNNWKDAYILLLPASVPTHANVISSPFVFKVKDDDDSKLKMKGRLALHGNGDKDRFSVRRDSLSDDLSIVRMIISLSLLLGFNLATAHVKGAYMQSGPNHRDIYVRPRNRIDDRQTSIWKLLHLAYGIYEAGRRWLCTIENWMT